MNATDSTPSNTASEAKSSIERATTRLTSIDAYRGLVMLLMVAEILELSHLKDDFTGSGLAAWISFHTSHVAWVGCSLHDMIQPSFSFLVGTAMAFSLAKRRQLGQSFALMALHAAWRSILLVLLGVFLRSLNKTSTYWTFTDTLSQIGFGYFALFLLAFCTMRTQLAAIVLVLLGYWSLFAAYPTPRADFDYASVAATSEHLSDGFQSHWNKNTNPAMEFDRWFLNLFPQEIRFEFQPGGYATINFIPTLATMLLGLLAGEKLRSVNSGREKLWWLLMAGTVCLAVGWALGFLSICPIVKRIWTPSFALYSGGICFLMLAGFYVVIDLGGWRRWSFPLTVIGMNSIAIYVMDKTMKDFFHDALARHLDWIWVHLSPEVASTTINIGVMLIFWWLLYWMYRNRVFVKI